MFDKIKKLLGVKNVEPRPESLSETAPKSKKKLSPKEEANAKGEPYIAILKVDLDPTNINNGSFELDWNDKFIVNLVKQGYKVKPTDTDNDIVDRWFQNVCRHVVMETWEQEQAIRKSGIYVQSRNIGDGRSEVS